MPKQFNPANLRVLYAAQWEYADVNPFTQQHPHCTGVYYPTEKLARQEGAAMMKECPGQYSGYEIVTCTACLGTMFETHRKALEGGTVTN